MLSKYRSVSTENHVVWRETADGVVLVDPSGGRVRVLNPVGSDIWKQISSGCDVATIRTNIETKYAVSAEKAASDLETFLDTLAERNLIQTA